MSAGNTIAVIDYGMGNLRSVSKALEHVAGGKPVVVTADPAVVAAAGRVVFPGQGAMPDCMRELDARGLRSAVLQAAKDKPFLGICVGEQMLFQHSDEGNVPALGVFPGNVVRFPDDKMRLPTGERLKVPHMGWNTVRQVPHGGAVHPVWQGIPDQSHFYFVHSFFARPTDARHCAGETDYGGAFASAIARDNIFATQFHPEKSAEQGLALYRNFLHWNP